MSSYISPPVDDAVRSQWKWFVAFGVVLAILGIVALFNVVDATLVTAVIVGFLLVIGGIAQIVGAFFQSGPTWMRVLQVVLGVLYVVVGANIIADPLAGAIAITVVIGIYLVIVGIMRFASALMMRPPHTWLLVLVAIINFVLGVWILTGIPYSGIAIGFFVGIELLMGGIIWIAVGWATRSLTDETAIPA
jgi:uncharacterized membrane protein HdeD (DUF308 family)